MNMAILGTGVDIIEIGRIENAIKNPAFVNRVYTANEIEYFASRGGNPCHAAGNFAAKEAVLKALGTGLRDIGWKDIEILRDTLGKPFVILYGSAKSMAEEAGIKSVHVSISHSRGNAIAQAIVEGQGDLCEGCSSRTDEKNR
jgi:holo-[acyl-carrier-protein] synthase